ncbi:PaaI family thioesterase [Mycolicibacterium sp. Dal123E01]|uniref:PaaI family thioesterase n=1 Tax=Mycolicibacterium sp. Dal123E01 TaxID=3457578 RepID=UPI00403EC35E
MTIDPCSLMPIGKVVGRCTVSWRGPAELPAVGLTMSGIDLQGKAYVSAEIKVSYLQAVYPDGRHVTAIGTGRKVGSRLGFAEGVVTGANGAVVATASSTLLGSDT